MPVARGQAPAVIRILARSAKLMVQRRHPDAAIHQCGQVYGFGEQVPRVVTRQRARQCGLPDTLLSFEQVSDALARVIDQVLQQIISLLQCDGVAFRDVHVGNAPVMLWVDALGCGGGQVVLLQVALVARLDWIDGARAPTKLALSLLGFVCIAVVLKGVFRGGSAGLWHAHVISPLGIC